MSVVDLRYVLPDDLDVVALPEEQEVLVSRRGTRVPPQVLSAEAWALVELFRVPSTLVAAVRDHCATTGSEPVATLEAAFPVLVALTHSDVLVAEGSAAASSPASRLRAGETVGPARVTARLRVLRDSELWDAVLPDGAQVVVKIVDDPVIGADLFARERAALQRLAGGPVPDLLWSEQSPTGGTLVLSAVDGEPVDLAVTASHCEAGRPGRVEVALAVLDAYTELHDRGVLHGDVHAGNVLVDRLGRVTVIDFGLADVTDAGLPSPPRSSGGEQLDPVAAEALRAGRAAPPLDAGAEQYAIGALLYRILTGAAYLDLGRERGEALAAVMSEPPRSFAEVGAVPWPEGERVVRRALAKAPWLRFASVAQLRACFATETERLVPRMSATDDLQRSVGNAVRQLDVDGARWADTAGPETAQAARFLRQIAVLTGDVTAHDLALLWAVRAGTVEPPASESANTPSRKLSHLPRRPDGEAIA